MDGAPRRVSSTELLQLLEVLVAAHRAARGSGGDPCQGAAEPVLASDGDDTIWHGDLGEAAFRALVASGDVREQAGEELAREAQRHGIELSGDAVALARGLLAAFLGGRYPERDAFAMMAWAFAGWTPAELGVFSDRLLDDFGFEGAVRPSMLRVIEWAGSRGLPLYLVSASPEAVVQAAARRLGIEPRRVLGMRPAVGPDGRLSAALDAPATYAEGKLARLGVALGDATLLAAFGDSGYDAAMLGAARLAVAVAPRAGLLAALPTFGSVVVLGEQ
jgi:phosphoserine phosphatase